MDFEPDPPLRVALVVTSPEYGGAEGYLVRLYQHLSSLGLVTVDLVGGFPGWPTDLGVVIPCRHKEKLSAHMSARSLFGLLARSVRAAMIIRNGHYDVVHLQFKAEQLFASPMIRLPQVWTEHGALPRELPDLLVRLYRLNSQRASVVAITDGICENLRTHGVQAVVIENPIGPRPAEGQVDRLVRDGPKTYAYVGRLHPVKRIELLLEVAELLPHARFLVVGDGPDAQRLRSIATANVSFLGFVPNVEDILESVDVLILTSGPAANEGSPLAMQEAREMGVDVLVMNDSHARHEAAKLGCGICEPDAIAIRNSLLHRPPVEPLSAEALRGRSTAEWSSRYLEELSSHPAQPAHPTRSWLSKVNPISHRR